MTGTDGDTVTAECDARAYHRLGEQVWMVAGRYTLTVTAGRVAGIVLHTLYEEGSRQLIDEAGRRAAQP